MRFILVLAFLDLLDAMYQASKKPSSPARQVSVRVCEKTALHPLARARGSEGVSDFRVSYRAATARKRVDRTVFSQTRQQGDKALPSPRSRVYRSMDLSTLSPRIQLTGFQHMLTALRITCRTLAKSPAFSITAIAALALGIGANTAIFSVVNQVLLNPAGVSHPERIVALRVKYDKLALKSISVSVPDFSDVQKSTQLFESAAVIGTGDYNYTGSGMPERLQGAAVSVQWFDVFGAKPRLGRIFQPEEDKPKANQVVVLSFAAWKRLFGQDAGVLGRTIELNRTPYRVIGVMGPEFRWPSNADLWVPLGLPAGRVQSRQSLQRKLRRRGSPEARNQVRASRGLHDHPQRSSAQQRQHEAAPMRRTPRGACSLCPSPISSPEIPKLPCWCCSHPWALFC